ncbi:hypothetical protein Bca101_072954 [Brassica carinata]
MANTINASLAFGSTPSGRHTSLPPQLDRHRLETSPELHHHKPRAQNTGEPASKPTLLFNALSSLWRASSIQSRSHPTEQSREPLGTTNREPHTSHKRDPKPIQRTETPKAGDAKLREPSPPRDKTDDGGAEEASTSRRQGPAATEL